MGSSKWIRQVTTHAFALVLGVLLTFGSLQVWSKPVTLSSNLVATEPKTPSVAIPVNAVSVANSADNFVTAAIERTGAAVVRIDTERIVSHQPNPILDDPFFRDFLGEQLPQNPQEERITGQGSGFITDKSGIILTNAHVIDGADKVTVTLKDGRTFQGEVKGTDEITDLAVVKIAPKGQDLPIAPLGDSSQVQVGDWAIAVGNPVGLNNTVTLGIISTLARSSAQVGIPDKRVEFLQTDAAINPGNSGGPLLNKQGEVIGINTAIRTDAMGIGFAIPINKAKSLKNALATGEQVPHPYIGIQMITLTTELAKQNNQDPNSPFLVPEMAGVLVVKVLPNTPAEKAGIRRGDVILQVNNNPLTSGDQLQTLVEATGVDKILDFQIQRGENKLNLKVKTAQLEQVN